MQMAEGTTGSLGLRTSRFGGDVSIIDPVAVTQWVVPSITARRRELLY